MKTTLKAATIASILTVGLTTSIWAAPASKLSHEGPGYKSPSNYQADSCHTDHVWFKHVGPRSKM